MPTLVVIVPLFKFLLDRNSVPSGVCGTDTGAEVK